MFYSTHLFHSTRMYIQLPLTAMHSGTTLNGAALSGSCLMVPGFALEEKRQVLSCPIGNPLQKMVHSIKTKIKIIPNGQQIHETVIIHFNNTNTNSATTDEQKFTFKNQIVNGFTAHARPLTDENILIDDTKTIVDENLILIQEFNVTNNGPARVQNAAIIVRFPR